MTGSVQYVMLQPNWQLGQDLIDEDYHSTDGWKVIYVIPEQRNTFLDLISAEENCSTLNCMRTNYGRIRCGQLRELHASSISEISSFKLIFYDRKEEEKKKYIPSLSWYCCFRLMYTTFSSVLQYSQLFRKTAPFLETLSGQLCQFSLWLKISRTYFDFVEYKYDSWFRNRTSKENY